MYLERIIEKCLKRDRAAEKLLYLHFAKQVFGICRRYSNDDHQAEDYMQDGFMKVFSNLKSYDAKKGHIEAWIVRIVVNTILSNKRKHKMKHQELQTELTDHLAVAPEESDEVLFRDIQASELLTAIRQLPIKYRDVLNLFIFENLTHQEIAQLMNIEVSSSRSRLTRAKKLLKTILTKQVTIPV